MNSKEISSDENESDSFESKKYYQKILITLGGLFLIFY